jgi:DNA-binding NtrC family response regulator
MFSDANGLDVLCWIRDRDPDTAVLMVTAFRTVENAVSDEAQRSTT